MNCAVSNCCATSAASCSAPAREVSKLSNARNTTKPRMIAKPVASTPKTPAARSPSVKNPSSGARRRTSRSPPMAAAATTTMTIAAHRYVTGAPRDPPRERNPDSPPSAHREAVRTMPIARRRRTPCVTKGVTTRARTAIADYQPLPTQRVQASADVGIAEVPGDRDRGARARGDVGTRRAKLQRLAVAGVGRGQPHSRNGATPPFDQHAIERQAQTVPGVNRVEQADGLAGGPARRRPCRSTYAVPGRLDDTRRLLQRHGCVIATSTRLRDRRRGRGFRPKSVGVTASASAAWMRLLRPSTAIASDQSFPAPADLAVGMAARAHHARRELRLVRGHAP